MTIEIRIQSCLKTREKAQERLSNYFEWVGPGNRRLRRHRTIGIRPGPNGTNPRMCDQSVPLRAPFREISLASSPVHDRIKMKDCIALICHSPFQTKINDEHACRTKVSDRGTHHYIDRAYESKWIACLKSSELKSERAMMSRRYRLVWPQGPIRSVDTRRSSRRHQIE